MTFQRLADLVYVLLPAYCANMAPPFVKYWHGWNRPISRKWLGDHKTVVGFGLGVVVGLTTAFIQSRVQLASTLWPREKWLVIGLALGVGAMCGDALKSFFKRRIGIAPGRPWIPFDQVDFVIAALVPASLIVALGWPDILAILVFTLVADIAVNQVSFRLGIRNTKW